MTIDEAIDQLKRCKGGVLITMWAEDDKALQLGIEALKYVQIARASNARLVDPLLIGETEKQ